MDTLSPEQRSRRMALVRAKGNASTELGMILLFRLYKISGWRRTQKLFGRPDFVFRRERVVVFVDGDFWHGHPRRGRMPKTRVEFWAAKIAANRRRDRVVSTTLRSQGWTVIRVWESSLKERPKEVARRLLVALSRIENNLGVQTAHL